ncbi:Fic family protein [Roseococcus sp.]|uniref:Fic family protein n=1 Tax=Roseococcus sp. TaxID=2109646 RepID=UPI003BADADAD
MSGSEGLQRGTEQAERLAQALQGLSVLQGRNQRVFRSSEFDVGKRTLLTKLGFLQSITRGWVMSSDPHAAPGDSTPWHASFWQFCAAYCEDRFADDWHLSPEQSLQLHAENSTIPRQVVVFSTKGGNNRLKLPFETSLFDSRERTAVPASLLEVKNGLRLFTLPAALARVPEGFYGQAPVDAEVALKSLNGASDLLAVLLDGDHSTVAGRLAGALRHVGRGDLADQIEMTFRRAAYDYRETDPFVTPPRSGPLRGYVAPIVGRIRTLWETSRQRVIDAFPQAPGLPEDHDAYLRSVEDIYKFDAYHSLSIEGYRVTPGLIERVRSGEWRPDEHTGDRDQRNAMAARGYYLAFERAKGVISGILEGGSPGEAMRRAHLEWYQDLFEPLVDAGVLTRKSTIGYRDHFIYLKTSRYVPPQKDLLPEAMSELLDLLSNEPEASVRAVLGHWLFGYIHPFPDGNGRTARLLMNAMLASGGYPWTVIRLEDRDDYLRGLDAASIEGDVGPFADFIADRVRLAMETYRPADGPPS